MKPLAQIGRFAVLRPLGTGAMGAVFLARHPGLGREVAIKVLHDRDPEVVARFKREAEVMARIRDPGVVQVLEAGVHEGQLFLVLEYVAGQDLADLLKERGALAPEEAAALVAGIARGVAAAHAAGVIHRDLKPGNVLLDAEGRPKVTDFGISARAGRGGAHSLTETGVLLGTPAYMAPEQALDAREVDARSDVYALGVILRECLSGERAFRGASGLAVLSAVMEGDATPLPAGLPPALVEVVETAMALDPNDRYSSAELLAEALEEARQAQGGPARSGALGALGALVLILGAAAGVALRGGQPTPAPSFSPSVASSPSPSLSPSPSPSLSPSPSPSAPVARAFPEPRTRAYFADKVRLWSADPATLRAEAARGHPAALTRLGRSAFEGRTGAPPRREGYDLIRRGAEGGDSEAAAVWAAHLVAKRDEGAAEWIERAQAWGSPHTLLKYASREKALEAAREGAALGDPVAHLFLIEDALNRGQRARVEELVAAAIEDGVPQAYAVRGTLRRDTPRPDLKGSFEDFQVAAKKGTAEGYCGLARSYALGLGVAKDRERALAYVEKAEAMGYAWAKHERVFCAREPAEWREILRSLKDAPRPDLCGQIGLFVLKRAKSTPDYRAAARFLYESRPLRAIDTRVPRELGILMASGFVPRDLGHFTRAQLFARAAELGDLRGVYAYGDALLQGSGGAEQDVAKGLELVRQASEGGVAEASNRLGEAYSGSQAWVERDLDRAIAAFRKAGEQGLLKSKVRAAELLLTAEEEDRQTLGRQLAEEAVVAYRAQEGLPEVELSFGAVARFLAGKSFRDRRAPEAARWAERSRAAKHPAGYSFSARLLSQDFRPDWEQVVALYRQAAQGGDVEGVCGLARCLAEGRGLPADPVRAAKLLGSIQDRHPRWASLEFLRLAAKTKKWKRWRSLFEALSRLEAKELEPFQWGELVLHALDVCDLVDATQAGQIRKRLPLLLGYAEAPMSLNSHLLFVAASYVGSGELRLVGPLGPRQLMAELLRRASNLGHPGGTLRFAQCLLLGDGVQRDVPGALRALRAAGEAGAWGAWVTLGDLQRTGVEGHLDPDLARAEESYRKAAEAKFPAGCAKLGALLLGRGENEEGVALLRTAIAGGSRSAEVLYAECQLWGTGVEADPAAAIRTLEASRSQPYALQVLSRAYREGRGVKRDRERADRLAEQAEALFKKLEAKKKKGF